MAAVEEGRKLNAKVLLGDRDVDITLQRLASALSTTDAEKYVYDVIVPFLRKIANIESGLPTSHMPYLEIITNPRVLQVQ